MMVAQPTGNLTTFEEYLALEETSSIKHEYVDGHVYAMSGGTLDHDRIANDVRSVLSTHTAGGGCDVFGPDVLVRVSATVAYYPDAVVICDETIDGSAREISTPRLIVEVLSDSTEANDRGDKWANYQTLDTLEEYLLVASRRRAVERFHRTEGGLWRYQRFGPDETITIERMGLTCPVAAFYRRTRL